MERPRILNKKLVRSAEEGKVEEVKKILKDGAKVHSDNEAALRRAAQKGHLEVVKVLLEKGADPLAEEGKSLYLAAENSRVEVLRLLIEKCVFRAGESRAENTVTPSVEKGVFQDSLDKILHRASEKGQTETAEILLGAGADIHSNNDYSLYRAVKNNHLLTVKFLAERGANVRACDSCALYAAAENYNPEIMKFLVEAGADVRAGGDYPLRQALAKNHREMIIFLLRAGASVHVDDELPLAWAAANGYSGVVKILLKKGAKVQAQNNRALRLAARNGQLEVVKFLVEAGADARDKEALLQASASSHLDVMKFLLEAGADVCIARVLSDISGEGRVEAVKFLLELIESERTKAVHAGSAFLRQNPNQTILNSALISASYNGHAEIVKIMVKAGAAIQDCYIRLSSIAAEGHLEVLRVLIEGGIDLSRDRDYALYMAAERGQAETVKFLLEQNVEFLCSNQQHKNSLPLELKGESGDLEESFLRKVEPRDQTDFLTETGNLYTNVLYTFLWRRVAASKKTEKIDFFLTHYLKAEERLLPRVISVLLKLPGLKRDERKACLAARGTFLSKCRRNIVSALERTMRHIYYRPGSSAFYRAISTE